MDNHLVNRTPARLRRFARQLLGPIARIFIRHGLNHRQLVEACKEAYVCEAAAVSDGDGPLNVSRVAMRTGMTRRGVRNIANQKDTAEDSGIFEIRQINATRVLTGWYQDEEFVDSNGIAKPLPLEGASGSLEALVRRYASDIPVGTIFSELIRAKVVIENDEGRYVPLTRYYIPEQMHPLHGEIIERSGDVLEDLGDTIDYNMHRGANDPARFERQASCKKIPAAAIPEFRQFVETEGQRFIESIDSWLDEHKTPADGSSDDELYRLGIGAYWIEKGPRSK